MALNPIGLPDSKTICCTKSVNTCRRTDSSMWSMSHFGPLLRRSQPLLQISNFRRDSRRIPTVRMLGNMRVLAVAPYPTTIYELNSRAHWFSKLSIRITLRSRTDMSKVVRLKIQTRCAPRYVFMTNETRATLRKPLRDPQPLRPIEWPNNQRIRNESRSFPSIHFGGFPRPDQVAPDEGS